MGVGATQRADGPEGADGPEEAEGPEGTGRNQSQAEPTVIAGETGSEASTGFSDLASESESESINLAEQTLPTPDYSSTRQVWHLGAQLGEGGMGVVYEVFSSDNDGQLYVAKMLKPNSTDTERARFFEEIEILKLLSGEGFPFLVDQIIDASGSPGFVMKRIQGFTMHKLIDDAQTQLACNPPEASKLFTSLIESLIKVCESIHGAHEKQIIHRDLKPENIMISQDGTKVYVLDVGLGKRTGSLFGAHLETTADSASTLSDTDTSPGQFQTMAGTVAGTCSYMAPEQIALLGPTGLSTFLRVPITEGDLSDLGSVGPRTDIFQLGIILYEIICGAPPSKYGNKNATLQESLLTNLSCNFEKPTPRCSLRGIAELQAIALKATQRNPADRYQSVADLLADLKAWQSQTKVTAYEESLPALKRSLYQAKHWLALRPRFDALLKTGLFTAVLGFCGYIYKNNERAHAEALANQQVETIGYQTDEALGAFIKALSTAITNISGSNTEILVSDLAAQIRALPADKLDNDAPKLNQAINDYSSVLAAARENMPGIGDAARDANRYLEEQIRALQDGRQALQTRITNRQAALDQYSTFIKAAEGPISVQAYQIGITFNLSRRPGGHIPITAPLAKIPELEPIALAASQDQLTPGYFDCSGLIEQFITRVQSDFLAGNLSDLEAKEYCKAVIQLLEGWVTSRLNRTDYRWMSIGISAEEAASLGGVMSALEKLRQANSEESSYSAAVLRLLYYDALARTSPEASTRRDATAERDRAREDLRAWNMAIEAALSGAKSAGATGDTTTLRLQRGNENHSVPGHATTRDILAYVNDLILQATPASIDQALVALQWLNENTKLPGEEEFRKEVMGGILARMAFIYGGDLKHYEDSRDSLAVAKKLIENAINNAVDADRASLAEIGDFVSSNIFTTRISGALRLASPDRDAVVRTCATEILKLPPNFPGLQALENARVYVPEETISDNQVMAYAAALSLEADQFGRCGACVVSILVEQGDWQLAVDQAFKIISMEEQEIDQISARDLMEYARNINLILKIPEILENNNDNSTISDMTIQFLEAAQRSRGPEDAENLFKYLRVGRDNFAELESLRPEASQILDALERPLHNFQ